MPREFWNGCNTCRQSKSKFTDDEYVAALEAGLSQTDLHAGAQLHFLNALAWQTPCSRIGFCKLSFLQHAMKANDKTMATSSSPAVGYELQALYIAGRTRHHKPPYEQVIPSS
jgi:hypothetical protein